MFLIILDVEIKHVYVVNWMLDMLSSCHALNAFLEAEIKQTTMLHSTTQFQFYFQKLECMWITATELSNIWKTLSKNYAFYKCAIFFNFYISIFR